jgi:DNA gyrase inhibitor GyrI
VEIEYLQNVGVIYLRRVGVYGPANRNLMRVFKNWVKSKNLFEGSTILGLSLDDPKMVPATKCRYDVCLVTDKKFQTVNHRTLTGGKYAIFKVSHTESAINQFYVTLESKLRGNQLTMLYRPIIERYQQQMVDEGYCELLVPIQ